MRSAGGLPGGLPDRHRVGAEAMKNFVVGCTVLALLGMVILAFGQERKECPDGRRIKTLQPCGSMTYYME